MNDWLHLLSDVITCQNLDAAYLIYVRKSVPISSKAPVWVLGKQYDSVSTRNIIIEEGRNALFSTWSLANITNHEPSAYFVRSATESAYYSCITYLSIYIYIYISYDNIDLCCWYDVQQSTHILRDRISALKTTCVCAQKKPIALAQ